MSVRSCRSAVSESPELRALKAQVLDRRSRDRYRSLSWCYDLLAKSVFGDAISRSQERLLELHSAELTACERAIWVGGGTGRLLKRLLTLAPRAEVIYVEPSASMMSKAMRSLTAVERQRVRWVHDEHRWLYHHLDQSETFDVLITAFFLDVLFERDCRELARWAHGRVACWLFADFVPQSSFWGRALIGFMYRCFAVTTRIDQRHMLDLPSLISSEGWRPLRSARVASASDDDVVASARFARGLISVERFSAEL